MTVDPGPKLVVFDFDGCVVDSTRVAIECHVEAFRHVGLEVPPEVIADSIQGTYDETIASLSASVPEVAALREDKLRAELAAKKNSELLQQRESAPVFSLVPYLLRRLKKDGRRIGILSRSGNGRIKSILREFNLSTFFEPNLIVSGDNDLVIQPKPAADGLLEIQRRAGVKQSHDCVYIGDRHFDNLAAQRAGFSFFGAGWSSSCKFPIDSEPIKLRSLLDCWLLGLISTTADELAELSRLVSMKRCSAFIGAGFSLDAGFDDWSALVERLLGGSGETHQHLPIGSLPDLIEAYIRREGVIAEEKIVTTIRNALASPETPLLKHSLLAALGFDRIWTTNFDSLLEHAHGGKCQLITDDAQLTPAAEYPQVIKLNGSVNTTFAKLVLSTLSFDGLYVNRPELIRSLDSELSNRSCLFLGCSFTDPLTRRVLGALAHTRGRRASTPVHYTVMPPGDDLAESRLRAYGVHPIHVPEWASVQDFLSELTLRSRRHIAVISGAVIGADLALDQIQTLTWLGFGLAHLNFEIRLANGPGIAYPIVEGARRACELSGDRYRHRQVIQRYNRVLNVSDFLGMEQGNERTSERLKRVISPTGTLNFVKPDPLGDAYDAARREMFVGANVCIALGGRSDEPELDVGIRRGMEMEQDLADKNRVPYLPLPFMGGYAAIAHSRQKDTQFEKLCQSSLGQSPVSDLLMSIEKATTPYERGRLSAAVAALLCLGSRS